MSQEKLDCVLCFKEYKLIFDEIIEIGAYCKYLGSSPLQKKEYNFGRLNIYFYEIATRRTLVKSHASKNITTVLDESSEEEPKDIGIDL